MINLSQWLLWFVIYSFIGWVYESTLCSINEGRFINRGFLNGPFCPIYGFGAIIIIMAANKVAGNLFLLLIMGMLLTSALEYITAYVLEKLFNARWWDYSSYRFNLHGRISLAGAVVFGTMSVLLIKYIHPFVSKLTSDLSYNSIIILDSILFSILLIDFLVTVRHLLALNQRLQNIQNSFNSFVERSFMQANVLKNSLLEKFENSDFYTEQIKNLLKFEVFQNARLFNAFPRLKPLKYNDAWQVIKNYFVDKNK